MIPAAPKRKKALTLVDGRPDRRRKHRFDIDQEVKYRVMYGDRVAETGEGRTVDISSGGIRITTETILPVGQPVELSMRWPALLNRSCPMKLIICGCVLRSDERGTVVSVERYEFRTIGRSFQAGAPGPGATAVTGAPIHKTLTTTDLNVRELLRAGGHRGLGL